ncbi:secreted protein [Beggiatoa sp. PS]|nr:secreted protein [Beggiatoa sp. PS]
MKNIFVLINTLFLLISCVIFLAPVQAGVSVPVDAQAFWKTFRTAVLADNRDKVVSITQFPFKTRGDLDDDPIRSYHKRLIF